MFGRLRVLLLTVVFVFMSLTVLMIMNNQSSFSYTELLENRISELELRLRAAENTNMGKMRQLRQIQNVLKGIADLSPADNHSLLHAMSSGNIWWLLQNVSHQLMNTGQPDSGLFRYLPHLAYNANYLKPGFRLALKERTQASMVIGIPTVKREKKSYLIETLTSLVQSMSDEDRQKALIVVLVAEVDDMGAVNKIANDVKSAMPQYVESGLIEVIAPPKEFYPDLQNLALTLGDPIERVRWRSKQVLDFAFLMIYCRTRGAYYLQLEDDVIAKQNFIGSIMSFATKPGDWVYLSFSQLGFIGKLFRTQELYRFVDFILMFWSYKPVDWLLDQYLTVMVCNPDKPIKTCWSDKSKIAISFKPSLFQHVGQFSSLPGKVQRLKDKFFGAVDQFQAHGNPSADVSTSLKDYQSHSLQKAYVGETFFWALTPQAGDTVLFSFHPEISLQKIRLKSGNPEHPDDVFANTTVEIEPAADSGVKEDVLSSSYRALDDGYYVIGRFDELGEFSMELAENFPKIRSVRLSVRADSKNWIIISEILFEQRK